MKRLNWELLGVITALLASEAALAWWVWKQVAS